METFPKKQWVFSIFGTFGIRIPHYPFFRTKSVPVGMDFYELAPFVAIKSHLAPSGKKPASAFFAWRRLRDTVRRLPVAMADSDSDDSPARPAAKKRGAPARARRPRALQDGMSTEELLQLTGVRCRNGNSCCILESTGDTEASPEHRLPPNSSKAPLETPLPDGSGIALQQKALHVSTRSMSSRDSQESDDSPFVRVPKGKAAASKPTSKRPREEVAGAADLATSLPAKKLDRLALLWIASALSRDRKQGTGGEGTPRWRLRPRQHAITL